MITAASLSLTYRTKEAPRGSDPEIDAKRSRRLGHAALSSVAQRPGSGSDLQRRNDLSVLGARCVFRTRRRRQESRLASKEDRKNRDEGSEGRDKDNGWNSSHDDLR